jgi:hypothetical protein
MRRNGYRPPPRNRAGADKRRRARVRAQRVKKRQGSPEDRAECWKELPPVEDVGS